MNPHHDEAGTAPAGPPLRRLPAVPVPLSGESLFSWVDHLAFTYEVDRTQIMTRIGLEPKSAHAFRLARHTAELTVPAAMSLHTGTGLSPEAMHDMTLFGIVKKSEGRLRRHPEYDWAPEETWSFCPPCLEPPRPMAVAVVSVVGSDVSRPRSLYGVPLPRLRLSVLSVDPALGRAGTVPGVPRSRR